MKFGYTQVIIDHTIRQARGDVMYIMREHARNELHQEIKSRGLVPLEDSFKEEVIEGIERTKEHHEFRVSDPQNCKPGNDRCYQHKIAYYMRGLKVTWL